MREGRRLPLFVVCAWVAAVAGEASAQKKRSGFRTYTDVVREYKIKVPRFVEHVPVKDYDRQTIGRFTGTYDVEVSRRRKRKHSLTLLVVQIAKTRDVITGGTGEEEGPRDESIAAERERRVNEARSLEDYLRLRGLPSKGLSERTLGLLGKRGLENDEGLPYKGYVGPGVMAFVTETGAEIFGLVAVGSVDDNKKAILRSIRSLERGTFNRYIKEVADPYEESDLPDIPRRRKIRANLIKGWVAHDTQNFILVTNVKRTTTIKRMLTDLEVMRLAYMERFPPISQDALDVVSTVRVCDGYDEYLKYAGQRLRGTGGYWAFLDEELVLYNPDKRVPKALKWLGKVDPIAVLYHEAMHQYLHYSNGSIPPAPWFNEGYGEVFGGAKVNRTKGEITKINRNKSRIGLIRLARKRKTWPRLEPMLRMSQQEFYRKKPLQNYAFSWAFCYFLELEGQKRPERRNEAWAKIPSSYLVNLRAVVDEYRKTAAEAVSGEVEQAKWLFGSRVKIQKVAFERTFADIDFGEIEPAWVAAMKKW